jgi:hypothetical protein
MRFPWLTPTGATRIGGIDRGKPPRACSPGFNRSDATHKPPEGGTTNLAAKAQRRNDLQRPQHNAAGPSRQCLRPCFVAIWTGHSTAQFAFQRISGRGAWLDRRPKGVAAECSLLPVAEHPAANKYSPKRAASGCTESRMRQVTRPGLEPELTEPKSVVLPITLPGCGCLSSGVSRCGVSVRSQSVSRGSR